MCVCSGVAGLRLCPAPPGPRQACLGLRAGVQWCVSFGPCLLAVNTIFILHIKTDVICTMYFISATSNFMKFQLAKLTFGDKPPHTHTHTKRRKRLGGNFELTCFESRGPCHCGVFQVRSCSHHLHVQNTSLWSGETESLFNKSFTC